MQSRKFETLDGLRGVAALSVFAVHTPGATLAGLLPSAAIAVELFFMLSGFVLAHAYGDRLQGAMTWRDYAQRRVIRLYPLYALGWGLGFLLAILQFAQGVSQFSLSQIGAAFAANLFFLPAWQSGMPTLVPSARDAGIGLFPFDFPLWSLYSELLVSIGFGLLAPYLGRRVLIAMLAFFALVLVYFAKLHGGLNVGFQVGETLVGLSRAAFSFLMGVALHRIWRSGRVDWLRAPSWLVYLVLLGVFAFRPEQRTLSYELLAVFVVFPVLILSATGQPARWWAPLLSQLGAMSYAFYVLHVPVMLWADEVFQLTSAQRLPTGGGWLVVLAVATAALALLADRFYDRPVRAWLTRVLPNSAPWAHRAQGASWRSANDERHVRQDKERETENGG